MGKKRPQNKSLKKYPIFLTGKGVSNRKLFKKKTKMPLKGKGASIRRNKNIVLSLLNEFGVIALWRIDVHVFALPGCVWLFISYVEAIWKQRKRSFLIHNRF